MMEFVLIRIMLLNYFSQNFTICCQLKMLYTVLAHRVMLEKQNTVSLLVGLGFFWVIRILHI